MKSLNEIQTILHENIAEIKVKFQVKSISIFGSYTRDQQKPESDLDLLVEFSGPVGLLHIIKVENYLTDLLEISVDLVQRKYLRDELRSTILQELISL